MQFAVVFDRVESQHAGRAFIGFQQPGKHAHQRGFTRAVRANQPGHIAFLQGAVQRCDGGFIHARKAFHQIIELDNRIIHVGPHR
ncbi:hypothetical protein D3C76_1179520 [compost metagenome]